ALSRRAAGRRRVLLLVTDAGETTSHAHFETARRAAVRGEAMLYTIVIRAVKSESGRNTAGEHALETITETAGGAMYYPDNPSDRESLSGGPHRGLPPQSRRGYYPQPPPPDRSYRHVEIRLNLPGTAGGQSGHTLHYRKGYFTAGALE